MWSIGETVAFSSENKSISHLSLHASACDAPQNMYMCVQMDTAPGKKRRSYTKLFMSRHKPSDWSGRAFITAVILGMLLCSQQVLKKSVTQNLLCRMLWRKEFMRCIMSHALCFLPTRLTFAAQIKSDMLGLLTHQQLNISQGLRPMDFQTVPHLCID